MGTFVRIELVCHTLLMNFICLALRPNLHSIPLVRSRSGLAYDVLLILDHLFKGF